MRNRAFLIVLLVSMTPVAALGNKELLDGSQQRLLLSLEDMYWQNELSQNDRRKVTAALESKKDRLGEAAIKVVVLHELSETAPILRKGVGRYSSANKVLPKMVAVAFERGVDPVAYLRAASVEESSEDRRLARLPHRALDDRLFSLGEMITSIIVISEARALRSGSKGEPDIAGRTLSSFQQRLLAYSAMNPSTAIASMVAEVSNVEIATVKESVTTDILRTFGQEGVDTVLNRLSRANGGQDVSKYGLSILLTFLMMKAQSMDADTKQHAWRIVSGLDVGGSLTHRSQVDFLREELLE